MIAWQRAVFFLQNTIGYTEKVCDLCTGSNNTTYVTTRVLMILKWQKQPCIVLSAAGVVMK